MNVVRFTSRSGHRERASTCRLGAITGREQMQQMTRACALFDHLVGGHKQDRWHGQPERLSRFEVHRRLKLGSRLHREVGGTVPAQDAVNIKCRLPTHVGDFDSVGHETPASTTERNA